MLIIFSSAIGRLPVGGHAWSDMQYLAGLTALGHDVVYLEECGEGSWVYNWDTEQVTNDLEYPSNFVRDAVEPLGLQNKWIYRAGNRAEGMDIRAFLDFCSRADLLIVRGSPMALWRDEYFWPRRRIYVDIDPGFTQISLTNGDPALRQTVERCERLFTIGQRLGAADCPVPSGGREWLKTVAPVSLEHWPVVLDRAATHFTTIMQWRGFRDVTFEGITYGQKDREFPKFIDLPRFTSQPFRIALTGAPPERLSEYGWEVVEGWLPSRTPWSYRSFIQNSRAEFCVAKHGYVEMRGGWFSDRSVCYLASGRPVLVQDTGLTDWLPTGEGILTFRDVPGAIDGIEAINVDYERHCRAARQLAEQYFDAGRVLPPLLDVAMS